MCGPARPGPALVCSRVLNEVLQGPGAPRGEQPVCHVVLRQTGRRARTPGGPRGPARAPSPRADCADFPVADVGTLVLGGEGQEEQEEGPEAPHEGRREEAFGGRVLPLRRRRPAGALRPQVLHQGLPPALPGPGQAALRCVAVGARVSAGRGWGQADIQMAVLQTERSAFTGAPPRQGPQKLGPATAGPGSSWGGCWPGHGHGLACPPGL